MRIRSIKPEFWRSRHVAMLPWDLRLLFIGLWSYVDDNGVGIDDAWQIQSDVFPVEGDPMDARERVSRGLATLSRVVHESSYAPLIVRYEVDGRRYLAITGWRHQRIDRPSKPRYPEPTAEDLSRANAEAKQESRDTLASPPANNTSVTGEQGNRGTGETNSPNGLADVLALPVPDPEPKPSAYPEAFEQAWQTYGRKGAKKTAYGEWQRAIKRAPLRVIVEAIPPYVAATPDTKFRKDFERWLKGDCWESAVVSSRQPVNGYQPFTNPTNHDAYDEELI
jgi:hypothetical protein